MDFKQLKKLLEKELQFQEKLLKLLAKETSAIVSMKQQDIDAINAEKQELLKKAAAVGHERSEIIKEVVGKAKAAKFADVVAHCPEGALKESLTKVGSDLKDLTVRVKELNDHNGILVRQTLGTVIAAVAIFKGAGSDELPTYCATGSMKSDKEETRTALITRSA
jgi:flagellar biosynthesis/type III secretory pathway chaperone